MKKGSAYMERVSPQKTELVIRHGSALITVADFSERLTLIGIEQLVQTMNLGQRVMDLLEGSLPKKDIPESCFLVSVQSPRVLAENAVGVLVVAIQYPESGEEPTDTDLVELIQRFKLTA